MYVLLAPSSLIVAGPVKSKVGTGADVSATVIEYVSTTGPVMDPVLIEIVYASGPSAAASAIAVTSNVAEF